MQILHFINFMCITSISGFMNINSNANLYVLVFAVLKALLSSLQPEDICSVRRV